MSRIVVFVFANRPGPHQAALRDELPRLLAAAGKFKLRAVLGQGLMACMPDAVAWMAFVADLIGAETAREKLLDGLAHEGARRPKKYPCVETSFAIPPR